jgi:RNA polymerase sigma factor (sigma-70 family)
MAAHEKQTESSPVCKGRFATTHWSMVIRAGHDRSSEAERALAVLCENYWFPLYAFVRRTGRSAEDARDLTQEFFARLLAQRLIAAADREKGRFRSFLLGAMKHFLADQWDREHAQKRGGCEKVISFDALDAETRYRLEPATDLTPERLFEKQWALSLLGQVLWRLQSEMVALDRSALFDALRDTLTGGSSSSYAAIASRLGMTEGAVKTAAHRLRRRYRELLHDEIAQTVVSSEDVKDEIRYLLSCL